MGCKYELAVWERKTYGNTGYHYRNVYSGNSLFGLWWGLWQNRKYGARQVTIR